MKKLSGLMMILVILLAPTSAIVEQGSCGYVCWEGQTPDGEIVSRCTYGFDNDSKCLGWYNGANEYQCMGWDDGCIYLGL